jgi:chloride channel protein, CIC family
MSPRRPRYEPLGGRQLVAEEIPPRPAGQRVRVPAPLIRRRLGSGRGATEQPNAVGDGDAPLSVLVWVLIALTGVAAGLLGDLMMIILFSVEHLAFGYHSGDFASGVEHAPGWRRIAMLALAGLLGGVAWYLLRRYTPGQRSEVDDAVWSGDATLSVPRSMGTSVISEVVVGMGASLGREAAPKLLGATSGSLLARWTGLSAAQRRLLVACGAGAGLAAVYNVPLGGALFTAEVLYGSVTLPVVLPALVCSWIATLTAQLYLPSHATYLDVPHYPFASSQLVWAVLAGPVIGVAAVGFIRLIGWVSVHRPAGRTALVAPLAAFTALGLLALHYPQLLGNGKDMAHDVFLSSGGLLTLFALFTLKPLVTAMCLGSGASGGLFTPTLSTGAVLGGFLGMLWSLLWPGVPLGAYAIIGAAATMGAGMQAPLAGLVLVVELTHSGLHLMLPMIAATALATTVARYLDGYSIYSARLAPHGELAGAAQRRELDQTDLKRAPQRR